jgi:hypothetical protein
MHSYRYARSQRKWIRSRFISSGDGGDESLNARGVHLLGDTASRTHAVDVVRSFLGNELSPVRRRLLTGHLPLQSPAVSVCAGAAVYAITCRVAGCARSECCAVDSCALRCL